MCVFLILRGRKIGWEQPVLMYMECCYHQPYFLNSWFPSHARVWDIIIIDLVIGLDFEVTFRMERGEFPCKEYFDIERARNIVQKQNMPCVCVCVFFFLPLLSTNIYPTSSWCIVQRHHQYLIALAITLARTILYWQCHYASPCKGGEVQKGGGVLWLKMMSVIPLVSICVIQIIYMHVSP